MRGPQANRIRIGEHTREALFDQGAIPTPYLGDRRVLRRRHLGVDDDDARPMALAGSDCRSEGIDDVAEIVDASTYGRDAEHEGRPARGPHVTASAVSC